jgi:hypothetical protein
VETPAIAKYDNAWLLWYLSADTDVTLIYSTAHDGLLTLLWRTSRTPSSPCWR